MLTTLTEKIDPRHAALIVVDMQNDYCHEDGVVGKRGVDLSMIQRVVEPLDRLIEEARKVNLPIIWVRTENNEWTMSEAWIEQRSYIPEEGRYPCWEGSWGAEFYGVAPKPGERLVTKHRYSAFINTDLDTVLKSKGIKSLLLTGVATNVCVESTARDGFMLDYYVTFVEDCCGATSLEDHAATLHNVRRHFGVVTTSNEIISEWAALKEPVRERRE